MLNMQAKSMMDAVMDAVDIPLAVLTPDLDNLDDLLLCPKTTDPVLSEDIWKKFGIDLCFDPDPCDVVNALDELFGKVEDKLPPPDQCNVIRNHDCMWAGVCASREHTPEQKCYRASYRLTGVVTPGIEKTPATKQQPVPAGRSLLLKTVIKSAPAPVLPSPDSPPISDDEETKEQTSTLKMLNDAIDECDIEEDSDLCDYFDECDLVADADDNDDEEEEEVQEDVKPQLQPSKPVFAAETDHSYHDHSYHKDKNASMRMANLGIETPSDSEEEIDVVSIGEKQNVISNRMGYALPTNPSSRDRQQLQLTMASAITNHKRLPSGIKTLPPIRKCSSGESTPTKRRIQDTTRGVKRQKHQYYRTTTKTEPPPSKRRSIQAGNSSDSEPESEKRSLHNNMERQRRIDLRNAFEDLRMIVPEVSSRERAAKVVILREASLYCDYLGDASESMQRKVQELRRKQEHLRARVSQLRRSLAAKR